MLKGLLPFTSLRSYLNSGVQAYLARDRKKFMIQNIYPRFWFILWIVAHTSVAETIIDKTEVSNEEYKVFQAANPDYKLPKYWQEYRSKFFINSVAAKLAPFNKATFTKPKHPVVGVDWYMATAYCNWKGKRLPSRKEWMQFAGVADNRIWPWGNDWDYAKANTGGEKWGENDAYIYSAPVNSFQNGASPFGALNMAGNVAEWTADQFVVGGSSNSSPSGVSIKSKIKREPEYRSFDIGFRCILER